MNQYLKSLEKQASYTTTLNGAKTHNTSGDACLDFFAVAGGMRYRRKADQITLFDRAYLENPELAKKTGDGSLSYSNAFSMINFEISVSLLS